MRPLSRCPATMFHTSRTEFRFFSQHFHSAIFTFYFAARFYRYSRTDDIYAGLCSKCAGNAHQNRYRIQQRFFLLLLPLLLLYSPNSTCNLCNSIPAEIFGQTNVLLKSYYILIFAEKEDTFFYGNLVEHTREIFTFEHKMRGIMWVFFYMKSAPFWIACFFMSIVKVRVSPKLSNTFLFLSNLKLLWKLGRSKGHSTT